MASLRLRLLDPLNLVGYVTAAVVGYTMLSLPMPDQRYALLAVATYVGVSLLMELMPFAAQRTLIGFVMSGALAVIALIAIWFGSHTGAAQILLVVWVAHASFYWPQRGLLITATLLNVAVYFIMVARDVGHPVLVTLLYACFQAFAALLSTYSRRLEEVRDDMAQVNADLLATRVLLAETTRSHERYRVARDLHDVAGHRLTALRLNLRALALAAPDQHALRDAEQLSADLLSDIRGVVQALRVDDALDIAPAFAALAAPFARPRLHADVSGEVCITEARTAEAVVRCVQEAITNAAKHGDASTVHVSLKVHDGHLHLAIQDDGPRIKRWVCGNGLQGMRERVEEAGGLVAFEADRSGGMHITATFPA